MNPLLGAAQKYSRVGRNLFNFFVFLPLAAPRFYLPVDFGWASQSETGVVHIKLYK